MARVANWRGQAARVQQYYEEGEKLVSKGKNLLVVTAALKILGLSWWALALFAPVLIGGHFVLGYLWVKRGWYAHGTEIGVVEKWTPISWWNMHMTVRMYQKLGLEMNHIPADRLPDEITAVMASTQRRAR